MKNTEVYYGRLILLTSDLGKSGARPAGIPMKE